MTTQLRADAPTFVPEFSIPAQNTASVRSRRRKTTAPPKKKKLTRKDEHNVHKKHPETRSAARSRRPIQRNGNESTITQRRSNKARPKKSRHRDGPDSGDLQETAVDSSDDIVWNDGAFPALTTSSTSVLQQGSVWDDKPVDILVMSDDFASTSLENTAQKEGALFIENNNDTANSDFSRLTILRKPMAGKAPLLESVDDFKKDSTSSCPDEASNGNEPTGRQKKKIDIEKLRNRWWAVVKSRPPPPVRVIESTESEDSDRTTPILVYQGPTPVDTTPKYLAVEDASVDSSYLHADNPILEAVRRNDEDALHALLKSTCKGAVDQHNDVIPHNPSPLQLAVDLERPNIVRLLVSAARKGAGFLQDNPRFPPALFVAVERDCEEILHIILHSSFGTGSYFTYTRDANGNNVFHVCCKTSVLSSVLRLVIAAPTSAGFVKLLSSTNDQGQNAIHVVCQQNKAEFLDILLSSTSSLGGSFALFAKVLSMQDNMGQTPLLAAVANGSSDCVMSLLMWRGNNHQNLIPKKMDVANNNASPPCSLAWAVKARDLDMVLLLLEFSDSGGSGYDLTGALQVAVLMRQQISDRKSTSSQVLISILRALVDAGANPCLFIEEPFPLWFTEACRLRPCGLGRCALVMSAEARDTEAIDALLKTYDSFLSRLRTKRRKDPVLAQQPESFFTGIESKERSERTIALRVSLITALVTWDDSFQERSDAIFSVLALYQVGANLGFCGLRYLQACLKEKSLRLLEDGCLVDSVPMTLRYRATYSHPLGDDLKHTNRSVDLQFWSRTMFTKPWSMQLRRNSGCAWIQSMDDIENDHPLPTDFVIVSEDGQRFETHSRLICEKSEKLAAAFRFSKMSSLEVEPIEIETAVSLGSELLSLLLYHMYHGSLPTSLEGVLLSNEQLLELLLIGEEFMCPTLIQECELRFLLGPACASRQCFCPSCSLLRHQCNDSGVLCTIGGTGSLLQCNIDPDVALDVLVLAQHIGHSSPTTNPQRYCLDVDVMVGDTTASHNVQRMPCLEALRLVSACVILDQFPAVLLSEAFLSQTREEEEEHRASRTLLMMCLNELSSLSNVSGLGSSSNSKYRDPIAYSISVSLD